MRTSLRAWILLSLTMMVVSKSAHALPSFTRKHHMTCSECHAICPKLTPTGRRFKENGLRLTDDGSAWRDLLRSFPGSLQGGFQAPFSADEVGPETGTFKAVLAGSGSDWLSFWIDRSVLISKAGLEDAREGFYWVRADDVLRSLRPRLLSVKAGQFELDLPFSQAYTYNLFPYAPDLVTGSLEGFATPHRGIEFSGTLGAGIRYSLAVADVVAGPYSDDVALALAIEDPLDADLYIRVSRTFQSDNRVGFFLYRGDNTQSVHALDQISTDSFPFRFTVQHETTLYGADLDWLSRTQRFNLYGLILWGRTDRALAADFVGGFAQWDTRLADSLALITRYSWTRSKWSPTALTELLGLDRREDRQSLELGLQWWPIARLKLALEYRALAENTDGPRGAFAVDFIF